MTTDPAAPAWWRAVRQARLLPLALPLLLTLAIIPLAQSGGRPSPAPPASETTVDAPAAPAGPALAPAARAPRPAVQLPGRAAQRPAIPRRAPRSTVVRGGPSSPPTAPTLDDAPPEEDDAVEEAVRCVEDPTVVLGTGSC